MNELLLASDDENSVEQWRFLGSFPNKMGGMHNIIVSRKASLLCPFKFLESDRQHHEVATLDTVVLVYKRPLPSSISVRVISSEEGRKDKWGGANTIKVPIGTAMFPPVRACASPLSKAIEDNPDETKTKERMTKLPVLVVELGTYI